MNFSFIDPYISKRRLWWIFVLGYFLVVYVPRLVMEGMFGDGLTYSSIGRNMAIGKGTFWAPYFSSSFWLPFNTTEVFYEHPPLAMFFQSLLFRLFGDHLFVEKIYSLLVCLVCIYVLSKLWKLIFEGSEWSRWDWLPVLVWLGMPEVEWTVPNNMLDDTQAMFCLIAAYLFLFAIKNETKTWVAFLAGISIFLGFLSKGPVSLFVLSIPVFAFAIPANRWLVWYAGGFLFLGTVIPLLMCYFYPPANVFLTHYIEQQFLSALMGKREITDASDSFWGHFHIFKAIYTQIFTGIISVAIAIALVAWRKGLKGLMVQYNALFLYFLMFSGLAVAGSFPIALSLKQADYYLLPSTPFYGMAIALLLVIFLQKLQDWTWQRLSLQKITGMVAIWLCFSIGFALFHIGKPRKYEKDIIHDLPLLCKYIPLSSKVWVCDAMITDFTIHTYLQRYFRVELTNDPSESRFFLTQEGCSPPDKSFEKVNEPFEKFSLYILK